MKILKTLIILSSILFFSCAFKANAASIMMINWRADSQSPVWYQGKNLPTSNSNVSVGLEVVKDGKIQDISKEAVRWYINDKIYKNENNGLGIKLINFKVSNRGSDGTINIRIVLPNYKDGFLDKIIEIPVVSSKLVLDLPNGNKAQKGKFEFSAFPFFINSIGDTVIYWRVSSQKGNSGISNPIIGQSSDFSFEIPFTADVGSSFNLLGQAVSLLGNSLLAQKNVEITIEQ